MQAIIAGAIADGSAYIPTRDTTESDLQYEQYYSADFRQPATYIRFSSTVEDCIGVAYCMGEDDAAFLKTYNGKRRGKEPCTDDAFEAVMSFFEETAAARQPFASIDNAPVLSFEEMEGAYDETLTEFDKRCARDIYEHWKLQRVKRENQPLMPSLKFEKNETTDDSDPYVCFRRREIRQARKTRGQGAQVTEKLKRLRQELEQARQLVHFVKQREVHRREQLTIDSNIFMQRGKVRDVKRQLNIKGDDEDLINQKVFMFSGSDLWPLTNASQPEPKPKPTVQSTIQRSAFPGHRPFNRNDGLSLRTSEIEYPQLDDLRKKQSDGIKSFVDENINKHKQWNKGWVDCTWRPITPPLDDDDAAGDSDAEHDPLGVELRGWRRIDVVEEAPSFAAGGLPTPPASIASPTADDDAAEGASQKPSGDVPSRNTRSRKPGVDLPLTVRMASPPADGIAAPEPIRPLLRKRVGRGGRLMIDRRAPKRSYSSTFPEPPVSSLSHPAYALHPYNLRKQSMSSDADTDDSHQLDELRTKDRFAFDNDDEDEEDEQCRPRVYYTDPYDNMNIRYRMMWNRSGTEQQAAQAQQQRRSTAGQGGSASVRAAV